ncbi:Rad2 nuclease [Myotisia sp. PD_48]|nr:Rad2 nuclease [Myotisia sp. PD_48]
MGITGLHGFLKSIQRPCNLKKFEGQTLGVDAYGWLHRGTISCAADLVLGKPTVKYVDFALGRVRMLQHFGITPYLVFDGGPLPSKEGTEIVRAARRAESKKLGEELLRRGQMTAAFQEFQKAVDVTPYMARVLIEELKKHGVQYVVAPYEADSQLVYLEKHGIINGIVSEDSDMLVFGAKRLISKLDKHGDCIELNRNDFAACRDISLIGWTDENFRHMCILSGCDYLPNIPRIGLKTAYRNLRRYKTVEKVVRMAQFDGSNRVPPGYLESFKRAELTFLHQRVFCPLAKKLVTLNPLTEADPEKDMPFIGANFEPDVAIGIACGDIDPITKEPIRLKQSYPERAVLVRTGRESLDLSTEKKPNREIREFFTPKRIPLAELDPNSLTPSPRQPLPLQATNRYNRRSLGVNPVSTPPSTRRNASSIPNTPVNRITERNSFLARASIITQPQAQKRQRLCSDAYEQRPTEKVTGSSSRFFTVSKGPDFLAREESLCKKFKSRKLAVFSDKDAVDISPTKRLETTIAEPVLSKEATPVTPITSEITASVAGSPLQVDPPKSRGLPTAKGLPTLADERTVDADSDPSLFGSVLEYNIQQHNLKLHERFAFNQSANNCNGVMKPLGIKPTQSSLGRTTPLQRLKHRALGRSKSMNSLQADRFHYDETRPWGNMSSQQQDEVPQRSRLVSHKGSEDMITPSSDRVEDEPDEEPEANDDSTADENKSFDSLDLNKYVFKPAKAT